MQGVCVSLCVLLFLLTLTVATTTANNVIGCGGFVEVSRELAHFKPKQLDLQFVKMELYTLEGVLKDSTECAPNGYYFLPLYDKGTFRIEIKGPVGFTFTPSTVVVAEGKCEGRDINFQLTGFTLSGKVGSSHKSSDKCGQNVGPEGVTVQLKGKDINVPARATITTQGGLYSFPNVIPGNYVLTASHPTWGFSKSEIGVQVDWGNVLVDEHFIVSGYSVTGQVATPTGELVSGVHFMLFGSGESEEFKCQHTDLELPSDHELGKPLCVVRSDSRGRFTFGNVPCGSYQIVPFYKSVQTTFDVAPSRQGVEVVQGDVALRETFQVVGFSVVGRVIDGLGAGIPDVTIIVDAQERATTDSAGYYTLDKIPVSSVTHDIEASKDHLFFDSLLQHPLTPSNPRLPDIRVTSYHLCGRILIEQRPPDVFLATHREVLLSNVAKKEERRSAEPSGNYCFEVHPGEYTVSPIISLEEQKAGLVFAPSAVAVTVTNAPMLDVNFKQVLVTVSGVVRCLESPCDTSISVVLSARDRPMRLTTGLGIGIAPIEEATGGRNEDYFVFRDVFPGVYELSVHRDAWCWENSTYMLEIKGRVDKISESAEGDNKQQQYIAPNFVQSGYVLTTLVSHDISLHLELDNSPQEQRTLNVSKGTNRFCVKKPGIYTLTPKSCYRFEQDSYKYDTSAPHVLDLITTHYMVNGSVTISLPDPPPSLPLQIRLLNREQREPIDTGRVLATLLSTTGGQTTYSWGVWALLLDAIEVTPLPYHPLLFYPPSQAYTLEKAECPPPLPPFVGREGKYLIGQVSPGLSGVKIQIINSTSGATVVTVPTLANGTYIAGPLYDNVAYHVLAEKEGYELTATGELNFAARKLAMISASVGVLADGVPQPLQGVLLSLSGEGYRNNNATTSDGVFAFSALSAGTYFLRPLLKEYVFDPSYMSIDVAEGEEKQISFTARRIAYSVYGSVRSLNGEGEKWVTVEALGPNGEREETQTDTHGDFRLRGLLPNVTYAISVKAQVERIERASPERQLLVMPSAEIHDIHFVVFRRPLKADITGEVVADLTLLPSLWVELYPSGSNSKLLAVRRVGPAGFFDFGALCKENEEYVLRVATSLSRQAYSFTSVEQSVMVSGPSVHVKLHFSATPNHTDKDVPHTPLYALAVAFVALAVAVYYQTK